MQPKGTVMVLGVYTHLLPIADLYGPGFHGRYRIHNSVYATLSDVYLDSEGQPSSYAEEAAEDYDDSEDYDTAPAPSSAAATTGS